VGGWDQPGSSPCTVCIAYLCVAAAAAAAAQGRFVDLPAGVIEAKNKPPYKYQVYDSFMRCYQPHDTAL